MKAMMLTGLRRMQMADIPQPEIRNNTDVLIKVEKVGVCGSDVHYYKTGRIGSQIVQFPFLVGHECAGTVEAVGSRVQRVTVGQQVVVDPAIWCGQCDQCRAGRENTCRNLKFLGCPGQIAGCLCEHIVMPESSCSPTGGRISLEQGALCEPLAIGIYAVKRSGLTADSSVAILGSGPIGLSCMAAAKALGVQTIYMTDKINERLTAAAANGAAWTGNPDRADIVAALTDKAPGGIDIIFECAGKQETIDEAIEFLRPGGKLMLIGIPEFERTSFVIDKMRRKEITVVNVRRQNRCTQIAVDWTGDRTVNVDFMVTHRFRFEETAAAFDLVAGYRDGVIKAMIEL